MEYQVRIFDPVDGTTSERVVQADDAATVRQLVQRDGHAVLSLHPLKSAAGGGTGRFDVGLFCQELRTLLTSGMTLVEAVELLGSKNSGARGRVLTGLRARLLEGKSLATALELSEYAFPRLLVASIRASEVSSRVEDALNEFITYDQLTRDLRRKLFSAALYPAMVIGFGALVCIFMLTYVVPRFAQVYDDFGHTLSLPTRLLVAAARFSREHWGVLFLLAGVALAGCVFGYRSGALQRAALRLALRLAVLRYYLRLFQLAQVYQTISMLLRGGYALSDALPIAQGLAWTEELQAHVEAATRAVSEGKRVSTAFAANGLTDQVSERLLQVGERSGHLAKVMDIIASGHRQEFTVAVERATRLIEPILLMAMGLLIGTIILLMYAPVFELAGAM